MIWLEVGNVGHVHTWTEVVQAVDTVEGLRTPYVAALITPMGAPDARIPMLAAECARIPAIGEEVAFEVTDTAAGRTITFCQHTR
ncbi:hypothetical protein [Saccharopolyspora spinosa]|uniref:hypothetical protein n=1 Tax=Saccharopolyspora spinosa TaxID=60894 RepID=UPI001ED9850E|nr:hypothetical protein [Saccharopolyspora spinosa]